MCHFHSVIVTADGRILHRPSNSHSGIAAHFGLENELDATWWECEWNGRGEMPAQLIQTRGKTSVPTQAAYRAAEAHYRKLAEIVRGDSDPMFCEPFDNHDE